LASIKQLRSSKSTFMSLRWHVMSIKLSPTVPYVTRPRPYSFEACYGVNPHTPTDTIPLSIEHRVSFEAQERAKEMKKLHAQIRAKIEKVNPSYMGTANKHRKSMVSNPRDLVWLHLRKERLPYRKPKQKNLVLREGPFKVLERIGENAYKLALPEDMNVSTTSNVVCLTPYVEVEFEDLKENPSQERKVDAYRALN